MCVTQTTTAYGYELRQTTGARFAASKIKILPREPGQWGARYDRRSRSRNKISARLVLGLWCLYRGAQNSISSGESNAAQQSSGREDLLQFLDGAGYRYGAVRSFHVSEKHPQCGVFFPDGPSANENGGVMLSHDPNWRAEAGQPGFKLCFKVKRHSAPVRLPCGPRAAPAE